MKLGSCTVVSAEYVTVVEDGEAILSEIMCVMIYPNHEVTRCDGLEA